MNDTAKVISDLTDEVNDLRDKLSMTQIDRGMDEFYAVDKYETLKYGLRREIKEQASLLAVGLEALRKGHADVFDEYVDRVLIKMIKQVNELTNLGEK